MKIIRLFHCKTRLPKEIEKKQQQYQSDMNLRFLFPVITWRITIIWYYTNRYQGIITMLYLFYLRVVLIHFNITDMLVLTDFKWLWDTKHNSEIKGKQLSYDIDKISYLWYTLLDHLAKGNVSFCHHLVSVIR